MNCNTLTKENLYLYKYIFSLFKNLCIYNYSSSIYIYF